MKYLIGLLLLLSSIGATAGPIPFPRCVVDGEHARYQSVRSNRVNKYNGQMFVAEADANSYPKIIFNRNVLSIHPIEWGYQVMLHECAHLQMHHHYDQDYQKELDADCSSAKRLQSEFKYTDAQFEIITDTMRKVKLPESRITAFKTCLK